MDCPRSLQPERVDGSSSIGPLNLPPGAVVSERYRILGILGRGGMGMVYKADDLKLGQVVALKFLPASLTRDPESVNRFLAEVRIARQVSHPLTPLWFASEWGMSGSASLQSMRKSFERRKGRGTDNVQYCSVLTNRE
jgi:serine/threonine protein kinase